MCLVLRPAPVVSEKYEFMESLATGDGKYAFAVSFMCVRLQVSRSGFYEWRDRRISATAQRRVDLGVLIEKSFVDSDETYGYRRVHAELAHWGVARVCPLGQMQNPPLAWRHDGRPALEDLVTWTDWEM